MLVTHGASFLTNKLEGEIVERIRKLALKTSLLLTVFAIICAYMAYNMEGYILSSDALHDGPSNPLKKAVSKEVGAWFNNYSTYPLLMLVPAIFYLANLLTFVSLLMKKYCIAFLSSCLAVVTMVANAGLVIFPFIMPSSTVPGSSLTVWDASSSHFTLFLMLLATIIFMPIILSYTAWAYRVMRGKISAEYIENNSKNLY
jgi:cytochrome d ubiquinol oxidase subunit II